MAIFRTGAGVKGKKSIPVDFMIYLFTISTLIAGSLSTGGQ